MPNYFKVLLILIAVSFTIGVVGLSTAQACGDKDEGKHPHDGGKCSHAKGEESSYAPKATGAGLRLVSYTSEEDEEAETHPHPEGKCTHAEGEGHAMMKNLKTEQKAAISQKVEAMKAEGATDEQIRAVVREMLKGYGVVPASAVGSSSEEKHPHPEGKCSHSGAKGAMGKTLGVLKGIALAPVRLVQYLL